MPATVTCPSCNTTLKPKTPVPAGTRIKCPKCQSVFVVPADDAAPGPRPAAAAPPPAEEEAAAVTGGADDTAEGDGTAKPKKEGIPLWVWLASAGGAVVLLCGCCGIGGWVASSFSNTTLNGPSSASVSWDNYNKIKKDMTEDQVKTIMGPTSMNLELMGVKSDIWRSGEDSITVTFQKDKAMDRSGQIGKQIKQGW